MASSKGLRRIAYVASFGVVAGVAAYSSYWHQVDVAMLAHQATALAHILPFSVDGMLIVASLAMAEDKAAERKPRGWARFGFWLGAIVSVAANVASTAAHFHDPLSVAVSSWAPIALLVTVEISSRPGKPKPIAPVATPAVMNVTAQAEEVVERSAALLPTPVSPAPGAASSERRTPAGSGPVARRASRSPLTGEILMAEAPKV